MTRLIYFARAGVPKTKVCWLNVDRTCTKESNRIGMEDCSITGLCDLYMHAAISLYAFGCKCCKQCCRDLI